MKRFKDTQKTVLKNLSAITYAETVPHLEIRRIQNPTKDSPPGYYDDNVFYYNFYQHTFQAKNIEWLYLHEALPGHHFETSENLKNQSPLQK